jgi:hypothetical protein
LFLGLMLNMVVEDLLWFFGWVCTYSFYEIVVLYYFFLGRDLYSFFFNVNFKSHNFQL